MKNIQLDENVLMELLELPTWLKINNAKCNKASLKVSQYFNFNFLEHFVKLYVFQIQWTKLKTHPIIIVSKSLK